MSHITLKSLTIESLTTALKSALSDINSEFVYTEYDDEEIYYNEHTDKSKFAPISYVRVGFIVEGQPDVELLISGYYREHGDKFSYEVESFADYEDVEEENKELGEVVAESLKKELKDACIEVLEYAENSRDLEETEKYLNREFYK